MRETILQFGAGRFLRAFFDRFVQHANDGGQNVGKIVIVQTTGGGRADLLKAQPDGYHVLVRGIENDKLVDRVEKISSISRALTANEQWDEVRALAQSPDLRIVVSNATESGYELKPGDALTSKPPQSMPAKLTQVLWWRFEAKREPLVLLPCELIEGNADKLRDIVTSISKEWGLPDAFRTWLRDRCVWLKNLVDCIITDAPPDHPLAAKDKLLASAEPYALLAVQRPADKSEPLFTDPAILWTDDVLPYFLRKVRILNGLHTAMVCKFYGKGQSFQTVSEVLADPKAARWIRDLVFEEIVPVIAYRVEDAALFADQTWDRLRNPFLDHKLANIMLNHEDKVRVRLKPTYDEYVRLFGKPPRRLSEVLQAK